MYKHFQFIENIQILKSNLNHIANKKRSDLWLNMQIYENILGIMSKI